MIRLNSGVRYLVVVSLTERVWNLESSKGLFDAAIPITGIFYDVFVQPLPSWNPGARIFTASARIL